MCRSTSATVDQPYPSAELRHHQRLRRKYRRVTDGEADVVEEHGWASVFTRNASGSTGLRRGTANCCCHGILGASTAPGLIHERKGEVGVHGNLNGEIAMTELIAKNTKLTAVGQLFALLGLSGVFGYFAYWPKT